MIFDQKQSLDGVELSGPEIHDLLAEIDTTYNGRMELWDYFQVNSHWRMDMGFRPHLQSSHRYIAGFAHTIRGLVLLPLIILRFRVIVKYLCSLWVGLNHIQFANGFGKLCAGNVDICLFVYFFVK